MSKEKHYHKVPRTSKGVLSFIQHRLDRSKVVGYLHPDNVLRRQIDRSFQVGEDMEHGVQYDPRTVRLQEQVYTPSVTHKEDPRLRD